MKATSEPTDAVLLKDSCNVMVLYEDAATRQRGLAACDYLVQRFWSEMEFDFHWWRTDFLADEALAAIAAEKAAEADLIIYCSEAAGEPSSTIKDWFDSWVERRPGRDGLMVSLIAGHTPADLPPPGDVFLREISRRAELDYLGSFPATFTGTFPSSVTEAEHRAREMSLVLDELLRRPPPQHFGIND